MEWIFEEKNIIVSLLEAVPLRAFLFTRREKAVVLLHRRRKHRVACLCAAGDGGSQEKGRFLGRAGRSDPFWERAKQNPICLLKLSIQC